MKLLFFKLLMFFLFFIDCSYAQQKPLDRNLTRLFGRDYGKAPDSFESYLRHFRRETEFYPTEEEIRKTERRKINSEQQNGGMRKFHERLIKATKEKDKDTLFKMFKIPFSVSLGLGRGLGIKNREDFNKHFDFIFNDKVCKAIIDSTPYSFWEHGTWGMFLNLGREKFWFDGYENNDGQHFTDYNLEEEKTNQEGKKILVKMKMCFLIDVINSGPPKYEVAGDEWE